LTRSGLTGVMVGVTVFLGIYSSSGLLLLYGGREIYTFFPCYVDCAGISFKGKGPCWTEKGLLRGLI